MFSAAVGMMPTQIQKEVCLQYQKERLFFTPKPMQSKIISPEIKPIELMNTAQNI